jgi:hypothetical protein
VTQVALVENANTNNIAIITEGNYRLDLPDGTQISPVYAGWTGITYKICPINFDQPIPVYVKDVNLGANLGISYTANDVLTISGGTAIGNTAKVQVFSIGSNGIVTSVLITNSGFYTAPPTSALNSPTGGTGNGVNLNLLLSDYPISNRTYIYISNTNSVKETNSYQPPVINNSRSIELQRQNSLEGDSGNMTLKDKLRTATAAQIDNWLQTNVNNLTDARNVLGSIIKYLANQI